MIYISNVGDVRAVKHQRNSSKIRSIKLARLAMFCLRYHCASWHISLANDLITEHLSDETAYRRNISYIGKLLTKLGQ